MFVYCSLDADGGRRRGRMVEKMVSCGLNQSRDPPPPRGGMKNLHIHSSTSTHSAAAGRVDSFISSNFCKGQ